jgi:RNA polymerase sigma-70 factor (ECF subfamily)
MYQQTNVNETLPFQGDAINELFAQHYKVSLRAAHRILRSKEDSEDVVQTAYCAAFRHFHEFRGESSFKTWITRIVMNCCLMHLRERRARPQVALDDIQPALASHAASPEALCYLAELQAAHMSAALRLPKVLHDVYAESVISGIAFPKVVHHLNLTPTAAKSRLFRARRKVEHSLQSVIQGRAA